MTIQERKWMEELVREKLADTLTANQLTAVLNAMWEAGADMERIATAIGEKTAADDELVKVYLQTMKVEGRSEKTIYQYGRLLDRLLTFCCVPAGSITTNHLRQWFAAEMERGISLTTLRGNRFVFSSCFGWLWKEGLIKANPVSNMGPIKAPKLKKEPFSAVELELIKESCTTARDKAVVCFLLSTGCRVAEAVSLNKDDIDFQSKEVKVLGKGNKERTVFLDDVASAMLFRYFADRNDHDEALFSSRSSPRLTADGLRQMLKRIEAKSGVENIHPHRFRRTLATSLARKGMPVQEIKEILGHEKIETTMTYISIDQTQVKSHYQAIVA